MPRIAKFLIGLAVSLLAGWISHGPLGQGAAFIDRLDAEANAVAHRDLPSVHVRFSRDPLSREAILSGQADEFQREGQGQFPGINARIRAIPGVSKIRWDDNDCCVREETLNAAGH